MSTKTLPKPYACYLIETLEARCCKNPDPYVLIEEKLFSQDQKIFCHNCKSQLKLKTESFLNPV